MGLKLIYLNKNKKMSFYLTNVNIIEKKKNIEEKKNERNKIELNQIKNNTEKKINVKEQKKEKKKYKKRKATI